MPPDQDIDLICQEYHITNYTINTDGSIDVHGNVNLSSKNLTKLPLNFRNVSGDFICDNNQLISLEGAPKDVGGDFICNDNKLTTLEGGPRRVRGNYFCGNNFITTLDGLTELFDGIFYCYKNPIYKIWKLFNNKNQIEYFNDHDIVRMDNDILSILLDRLNSFLEDLGKPTVESVEGYANIY